MKNKTIVAIILVLTLSTSAMAFPHHHRPRHHRPPHRMEHQDRWPMPPRQSEMPQYENYEDSSTTSNNSETYSYNPDGAGDTFKKAFANAAEEAAGAVAGEILGNVLGAMFKQ